MSSAFQNFLEYRQAIEAYNKTHDMLERCKKSNDAVLIDNAFKDTKLEIFKKDWIALLASTSL
jgi:hypothetical protein